MDKTLIYITFLIFSSSLFAYDYEKEKRENAINGLKMIREIKEKIRREEIEANAIKKKNLKESSLRKMLKRKIEVNISSSKDKDNN